MNENTKQEKSKLLSIEDIKYLTFNTCNIYNILELYNRDTFNIALQSLISKKAIVFLLISKNTPLDYGHFVCMTIHKDTVYYFDSYALGILNIPFDTKDILISFSEMLMNNYGYRISENKIPYQSLKDKNSNYCGRIVSLRVMHRFITTENFDNIMSVKISIDTPTDKILSMTCTIDLRDMCLKYIEKTNKQLEQK